MLSRPAGRFFRRLCPARGRAARLYDRGSRVAEDADPADHGADQRPDPVWRYRDDAGARASVGPGPRARAPRLAPSRDPAPRAGPPLPSLEPGASVPGRLRPSWWLSRPPRPEFTGGFWRVSSERTTLEIEGTAVVSLVHDRGKVIHGPQLGGTMPLFASFCLFLHSFALFCLFLPVLA